MSGKQLRVITCCSRALQLANKAAALIVCITSDNQEATDAGYANALTIPGLRSNVHIENLKMLDTDGRLIRSLDLTRFG